MSFRATTDLREKLERAASESGRSLTQELELRLERSFDHDQMVSSVMETIEENSQLQVQIMELQAELEKLKSAGPDASDLAVIVEQAVAKAFQMACSVQPAKDFMHEVQQYQSAPKSAKARVSAKSKA
ncbi:hypothetical protein BB934_09685 [Microvirga ossetica]|uniref:Uncharacterized protein n=2 Tax=Microvirga ossetica TaxID=1882682 RepID=A0A1B2EET5_9HYPH|nr:hypothetical protein BB934_09685 [Microvirga ossetica]